MEEWIEDWQSGAMMATGLFYAAFLVLGITAGASLGYLLGGHTWLNALIGLGVGVFTGIGFGLLSAAIIAARGIK